MFEGIKFRLASGSPRRRQLLAMLDVDFEVVQTKEVEECYPDSLDVKDVASYLSLLKADAYRADVGDNEIWITADTVVVCDGEVIGKPENLEVAKSMLRKLSGRQHLVITGVCVFDKNRLESFSNTTVVEFAPIGDLEIDEYVERYKPLDKAGAYGIQEFIGAVAVRRIDGSFYNVMGLPVNQLYGVLKKFIYR